METLPIMNYISLFMVPKIYKGKNYPHPHFASVFFMC